jgi:ferrous iron transport protein B
MNAEMDNKKWLWAGIGFQFGMGYTVSYLVYQIGTLITTGSFGTGVLGGLAVVAVVFGTLIYLMRNNQEKISLSFEGGV